MVVKKESKSKPKASYTKARKSVEELNKALIENFLSLQKVMTNLAVKFDNLSDNISKLLNLFEISARSFVEKQPSDIEKDREFLDKLNKLLDQNKTIAKGLTLMEEKIRERVYGQGEKREMPQPQMQQFPRQFIPSMMQPQTSNFPIEGNIQPSTQEITEDKFKKLPRY